MSKIKSRKYVFIGKKRVIYNYGIEQKIKFKHTLKSFGHSYRNVSVAIKAFFVESAFGRDGQLPLENARLAKCILQLSYLGNSRFALNSK